MKLDTLVDIILPLAISEVYTYRLPEAMIEAGKSLPIGARVLVPLGKKTITGILYRTHLGEIPTQVKVRDVIQVLDEVPVVTPKQLQLWEWLSQYYMCTLGEVLAAALPAGIIDDDYTALTTHYIYLSDAYLSQEAQQSLLVALRRAKAQEKLMRAFLAMDIAHKGVDRRLLLEQTQISGAILRSMVEKGIFRQEELPISRLKQYVGIPQSLHILDTQQQKALDDIQQGWKTHTVTLLHGVTSSGKTEVYMHLIDQCLQAGRQVLYLVPEIALTTQLTDRLRAVFGDKLLVYHSRFTSAERVEIYREVASVDNSGQGKLILGARSAIFLPFNDLGLIIVDEEHEPSYKQQDPAPRYHARSAAIMMAQWYGAKVLLGTATPSVESYHNAKQGKYALVSMTKRYQGLQLPRITMIDLQRQYHRKEMYGHFSDPLVLRIREELTKGKQVILFQNRRGYAPILQCSQCGEVPKCGNCDVSMTYHKGDQSLVCHYCGSSKKAPLLCPKCGGVMRAQGFGTERLEEEIYEWFPGAKVARMDLDSTRRKDSYQHIIDDFEAHRVDILVGTQMVTKGLHFDDVSLVAVLQADSLLNMPDFRSYEHAFQMLEQVSGRAGRKGDQGEVVIQTFDPENPLYTLLKEHNYEGLYEQQLGEREMFGFPPFYRIIMLTLRHRDLQRLEAAASLLQVRLKSSFGDRVSGVIMPSVGRVSNQWVRQVRLRVETSANIIGAKQLLKEHILYVQQQDRCKGTIIIPDVDPM